MFTLQLCTYYHDFILRISSSASQRSFQIRHSLHSMIIYFVEVLVKLPEYSTCHVNFAFTMWLEVVLHIFTVNY